jgi:predicted membrane protein
MFWGVLFVAIGVLVILRHYFGIQFPLIKVIFGILLVYFGVKILFTSFTKATPGTPTRLGPSQNIGLFSSSRFQYISNGKPQSFHTFFGDSDIDLSKMDLSRGDVDIELNVVFGEMLVVLGAQVPMQLESKALFGEIQLPNKKKITEGRHTFQSAILKASGAKINMRANAIFGEIKMYYGKF